MAGSQLSSIVANELIVGQTITPALMQKIDAACGDDMLSQAVKSQCWIGRTMNRATIKQLLALLGNPPKDKPELTNEPTTETETADSVDTEEKDGE